MAGEFSPGRGPGHLFDPPRAAGELGRFGKYRVLKQLGQGGMGFVFLAEDDRLGRQVALKFITPTLAADQKAKARFIQEAQAAAKLASEFVVQIYDVDELKGLPFIAMERLSGQPLEDFLEATRPSLAEVVRIGREIAEGLAAVHAAGLVHRDVKPSNVWLESPGRRTKLIDFGLARQTQADTRLTMSGQVVGTPEYMAPEQASGQPVDGRADLFGLGVMLYRLTTGVRPFARETVMASLAAVLTVSPPPPSAVNPDVPPPLSDLILALLAKDPVHRPPTARWVADALGCVAGLTHSGASTASRVLAGDGYPVPASRVGSGSLAEPISVTPSPADAWQGLSRTPDATALVSRPKARAMAWKWAGLAACLVGTATVAGVIFTTRERGSKWPDGTSPEPAATHRLPPLPGMSKSPPGTAAVTPKRPNPLRAPFTDMQAKAAQRAWAAFLRRPVEERLDLPGGVKLELVLIPPGSFMMGSPTSEAGRDENESAHSVEVRRPFYLGKYEVTQEQFLVVTGANPSRFKGERYPVDSVGRRAAVAFCTRLSTPFGTVALPSEAQWEYACRAGTTTPYHFGTTLNGQEANCNGGLPYGTKVLGPVLQRTCQVGQYKPNSFGVHDMHGNVWEWCQDYYGPYSEVETGPDPVRLQMPTDNSGVLRGGSWFIDAASCRAAVRRKILPKARYDDYGLRILVPLD